MYRPKSLRFFLWFKRYSWFTGVLIVLLGFPLEQTIMHWEVTLPQLYLWKLVFVLCILIHILLRVSKYCCGDCYLNVAVYSVALRKKAKRITATLRVWILNVSINKENTLSFLITVGYGELCPTPTFDPLSAATTSKANSVCLIHIHSLTDVKKTCVKANRICPTVVTFITLFRWYS